MPKRYDYEASHAGGLNYFDHPKLFSAHKSLVFAFHFKYVKPPLSETEAYSDTDKETNQRFRSKPSTEHMLNCK